MSQQRAYVCPSVGDRNAHVYTCARPPRRACFVPSRCSATKSEANQFDSARRACEPQAKRVRPPPESQLRTFGARRLKAKRVRSRAYGLLAERVRSTSPPVRRMPPVSKRELNDLQQHNILQHRTHRGAMQERINIYLYHIVHVVEKSVSEPESDSKPEPTTPRKGKIPLTPPRAPFLRFLSFSLARAL